jgi:hypothetical protein
VIDKTTVHNIRALPDDWAHNPDYVYIGRPGKGKPGPWGNPVAIGQECPVCNQVHRDAGSTLPCYRRYLDRRLRINPRFEARFRALKGKKLVCFCKPGPCHGDVMAEFLDNLDTTT